MIKECKGLIKDYINQYEDAIDYEYDINSLDDIKDDLIRNEIESLNNSIDDYTEQKLNGILSIMSINLKILKMG